VIQGPALTAATRSAFSFPSPNPLQYSTGQKPRTNDTPHSHKVHLPGQPASSSAQISQGTPRRWQLPHSTTPLLCEGTSTSHPVMQMAREPSSINFTTSTFSFRVPNQTDYLGSGVSENHQDPRPVPTGYASGGSSSAAFTQPPTQASVQMNAAPPRPSKWHSIVSIVTFLTST